MNSLIPRLENNEYIFTETVNGGYLSNSNYASYYITSKWNKELKLINLFVDNEDYTEYVIDKTKAKELKDDYHLNRAKRAYNRHLKELKIFLGLEKEEKVIKKKFIMIGHQYHSLLEFKELSLTKQGKPNMREAGQFTNCIVEETPELRKITENYNKKLKEWQKERDRVMDLLFKGR